jgi:hypothetical protein
MSDVKQSGNLKVASGQAVPSDDASSQALSEALGSSVWLMKAIVALLAAAFIASCIFTVKPNEVAVVLRFGKPQGTGPDMLKKQGLHFAKFRPRSPRLHGPMSILRKKPLERLRRPRIAIA